jgi:magnesium chelatase family protein
LSTFATVASSTGDATRPSSCDRIDLQIEIARVPFDDMVRRDGAEHSPAIRERVVAARATARERFSGSSIGANAEIPPSLMRTYCALDRIARVARTIADLAQSANIHAEHVAEAIQYRSLERLDGRAA